MRKTSVYLEDEQVQRLKRMAELRGRSQAEVLREAIDAYAEQVEQPRAFACAAVAEGPGGSVADLPDEKLLRGFGS